MKKQNLLTILLTLALMLNMATSALAVTNYVSAGPYDMGVSLNTRNNPFDIQIEDTIERLKYSSKLTDKITSCLTNPSIFYDVHITIQCEETLDDPEIETTDIDEYFSTRCDDNLIYVLFVMDINEARVYIGRNLDVPEVDVAAVEKAFSQCDSDDPAEKCITCLKKLADYLPITKVAMESRFNYDDDSRKVALASCFDKIHEKYPNLAIYVNTWEERSSSCAESMELLENSDNLYNDRSVVVYYTNTGDVAIHIGKECGLPEVDEQKVLDAFKPAENSEDISGFKSGIDELTNQVVRNDMEIYYICAGACIVFLLAIGGYIISKKKVNKNT